MARAVSTIALGVVAAAALAGMLAGHGSAQEPAARTDWPATSYNSAAVRYSPLDQITPQNVSMLQQAWSFNLKPSGYTGRLRENGGNPIVVGNTMYLTSPYGFVHALDATTGAERWNFQLPNDDIPSKRGLAYWPGDTGFAPAVIFGGTSGRLYSIGAVDGTPNQYFGTSGTINLKTPEVMQTGMDLPYSLLSSATIYKDLIIIGAGPGEGPRGSNSGSGPAGDTRAWDAKTGRLVWTFHTVPRAGEFGNDSWEERSWERRSGVNTWGYMSLDSERGILYMPLGAPNDDRVGVDRPGNNLFSSSVVAVEAETGKYLWHFQMTHHDLWDFDAPQAPILVDLRRGSETIPAVIAMNKNGLLFTLNRVTGKPVFEVEERPVPKSDVPKERTSPTQPFPVKPEPLSQITVSRDNLYKGEPAHQAYCERLVDDNNMRLAGPYAPPAFNRYSVTPPGPAGGINFWGGSYDPKLHLFVSNVNNMFQPMRIIQRPDGSFINSGPLAGTRRFGDPDRRLLCGPTPWGQLVAVNMDTGDIVYRKTLGISEQLPPGLQDTGRPSTGGVALTASGLTFVGGTDDFRFRAFATATGEKLWEIKLPSSITATPITYQGSDGRQFVAVVSTGGGLTLAQVTNDEIIAFALPRAGGSTNQAAAVPRAVQPAASTATPSAAGAGARPGDAYALLPAGEGRELVVRVCSQCHSPESASGQALDARGWRTLVDDMAAKGAQASDAELERIVTYLAGAFPQAR
jgi:quinoprotein glucose dehydrogenase